MYRPHQRFAAGDREPLLLLAPRAIRQRELRELTDEFVSAVKRGDHERRGWPSNGYRVSKIAMNAFTRILARELGATPIRVNAVCPGWVRTRMGGRDADRTPEEGRAESFGLRRLGNRGRAEAFFGEDQGIDW